MYTAQKIQLEEDDGCWQCGGNLSILDMVSRGGQCMINLVFMHVFCGTELEGSGWVLPAGCQHIAACVCAK